MAELEFNIARLQQCLDVTVGTPSVGDVVKVTSTSPLEFELGPGGGGTGTVNYVDGNDPISVDNTDPAYPIINIAIADKAQAGVVNDAPQEWWGVKTFDSLPISSQDPTDPEQLTTKKYVDTFAAGLQVKDAVRAATLVPGILASSFENGDIIDGVTLATGDRILIKNQTNPVENGIFTVNASGQPSRATDYDAAGEANVGTFTTVTEGGQKNTQWVQVNTGTPTPGTDALNFGRLNISGNVNTIQSPNIAHGTGGTLTGAVKLDSTDIYYSGYSGNTVKQEMVTVTTAGNASPQVISGAKKFTGAVDLQGGLAIATNQNLGTNTQQLATCAFVQTALANSITGGASTIRTANLTINRALISNALGKVAISPTTSAELSYVSGVTSPIQAQINNKLDSTTAASTYQPLDGDLTAIAGLSGTSGFLKKTAVDTWSLVSLEAVLNKTVQISSAQMLDSFLTAIELIPASEAGLGKAIQIISASIKNNYNSIPYVGGSNGMIVASTAGSNYQNIVGNATLIASSSMISICPFPTSITNNIKENDAIMYKAITQAPILGNSTFTIYLTYKIITL